MITLAAVLAIAAACADGPAGPPDAAGPPAEVVHVDSVVYRAAAELVHTDPPLVRTTVSATNEGTRPAALEVASHCTVLLRAYRGPDRTGLAAWDESRTRGTCTTLSRSVRLAPGETARFEAYATPPLARGRYYLVATLRRTARPIDVAAGHVDLP